MRETWRIDVEEFGPSILSGRFGPIVGRRTLRVVYEGPALAYQNLRCAGCDAFLRATQVMHTQDWLNGADQMTIDATHPEPFCAAPGIAKVAARERPVAQCAPVVATRVQRKITL